MYRKSVEVPNYCDVEKKSLTQPYKEEQKRNKHENILKQ